MNLTALLVLSAASLFRFCGDSNEEQAPPAAEAAAPAALSPQITAAAHGGSVIVTEDHAVEVLARADGSIQAFVRDGSGQSPAERAQLVVKVAGQDGQPHEIAMQWDAASTSYKGALQGIALVAGAADVTL